MKNKGSVLIFFLVFAIGLVVAAILGYVLFNQKKLQEDNGGSGNGNVHNFEECARAGYPVTESYPRQCKDSKGKNFVEEVTVQGPEIIKGVTSLLYEDKDLNFQFWYPVGVEIKSKGFEGYLSLTHNIAVGIFLPNSLFSGTNLNEAVFVVGTDEDKKVVENCLVKAGDQQEVDAGTTNINGADYRIFTDKGAVAGSIYDLKIYRTVQNNKCYEAVEMLHSGNIYNYEPGTVKEFNKEEMLGTLDKILNTFILVQGSGSGVVGSVVLGPTCPVERIPPDPQCSPKPYQTEITVTKSDQSTFSKMIESDALGKFRVELDSGLYTFSAKGGNMLPRCNPLDVNVPARGFIYANISCDTGIR